MNQNAHLRLLLILFLQIQIFFESKFIWAEELTGTNSATPCINEIKNI